MVVYIEYAFLENTLFDFALLCLSFLLCKTKIVWWKMLISACAGGIFAVFFPLICLPEILLSLLKITVGFLLCLIAFPPIKTKKDGGRYALNVGVFFFLTFVYGGALTALFSAVFPKKTPIFLVAFSFAFLSMLTLLIVKKIYEKRAVFRYIYPCKIAYNKRAFSVLGYMDSGNLARKNGVPVCFLSPDIFYDLFGEIILFNEEVKMDESRGQVCNEMAITTMSGEKKVRLFKGEIEVCISAEKTLKKQVYFCPSNNMINREYKVLLNAGIIEG